MCFKNIVLISSLIFCTLSGLSQSAVVNLNSPQAGSVNVSARDLVRMSTGFSYGASSTENGRFWINPYIITPVSYQSQLNDLDDRILDYSKEVGSIKGAFSVTSSGAATYNIPIVLPPGTAGMAPNVSLGYNSQSGDGVAGYGWHLSGVSVIQRVGENMFSDGDISPVSLDYTDKFALDGNRLHVVSGMYGSPSSEYVTEIESFQDVEAVGGSTGNPNYFVVKTKDGLTLEYGHIENGNNSKCIPQGSAVTLSWYLSKVVDQNGNYMLYSYYNNDSEVRLKGIKYTGTVSFSPYNEVVFQYVEKDIENSYFVSGGEVVNDLLLKNILVLCDGTQIKKYSLEHMQLGENNTACTNKYSFLQKIKLYGANNSSYNSTCFEYGDDFLPPEQTTAISLPEYVLNGEMVGDFDGNGFDDIISYNDTYSNYKLLLNNNGVLTEVSGALPANSYPLLPGEVKFSGLKVFDTNGDGVDEAIFRTKLGSYYTYEVYSYNGTSLVSQSMSFTFNGDHQILAGDFDGDGKDDIFITNGTTVKLIYNEGSEVVGGFPSLLYMANDALLCPIDFDGDGQLELLFPTIGDEYKVLDVNILSSGSVDVLDITEQTNAFSYGNGCSIWPGDFNGDGITDILYNYYNNWLLYAGTGDGYDQQVFTLPSGIGNALGVTDRLYVTDVNGDGKSDIVKVWNQIYVTASVFLSTGSGFHEYERWFQNHVLNVDGWVDVGDFDGNSTIDIMVVGTGQNAEGRFVQSLDNSRGEFQLQAISDGVGNLTKVEYSPLSFSGVYDSGSRSYSYPVVSGTVLPIDVVKMVETQDALGSPRTISYFYKGINYHYHGKGFLCFDEVKSTDNLNSQIVIDEYNFDQNYYSAVKTGTTVKNLSNAILSSSTYDYQYKVINSTIGNRRYFQHMWKEDHFDNLTDVRKNVEYEYDLNGNCQSIITKIGTYSSQQYQLDEEFDYVSFESNGIPNRISEKREKVYYNGTAGDIRKVTFDYNTNGRLETKIMDPDLPKPLTETYQYDVFGNLVLTNISTPGEVSRTNQYEYNDAKARFLTATENSRGYREEMSYDPRFGSLLTHKDINGNISTKSYDGFGAIIEETDEYGVNVTYDKDWVIPGGNLDALYFTTSVSSDLANETAYYNHVGKNVRTEIEGFDGAVICVDKTYKANGLIESESFPYYQGETPILKTFGYDSYNRLRTETDNGVQLQYTYTPHKVEVTNMSTNRTSSKEFDVLGNVVKATDAMGNIITYAYDPNARLSSISTMGATTTMSYDDYGAQNLLVDPNMGSVSYEYNRFGELVSQTDGNGTTQMSYDNLGRMTSTVTSDVTINYTYNENGNGLGQVAFVQSTDNAQKSYIYDENSNLISVSEGFSGDMFTTTFSYNNKGRLMETVYPSGFGVVNVYNDFGMLSQINNKDDGSLIWQLNEITARGSISEYQLGNGLTTNYTFNSSNGLLESIQTGQIQNLSYSFDYSTGNLMSRTDNKYSVTESFLYDDLDRLTDSDIPNQLVNDVVYANNGNITSKTDAGSYSYHPNKVHAVTNITSNPGTIPDDLQDIHYNSFHDVTSIEEGDKMLEITYGVDQARLKTVYSENNSVVLTKYFSGSYEKQVSSTGTKEIVYIPTPSGISAIWESVNGVSNIYYLYNDHLGSPYCLTNENGVILEEYSFDSWGRRRNPTNWSYTGFTSPSILDRGFTGHEHLDMFGLINMNGRMYDPVLGRMLSPDNFIQDPTNPQNYNRYAYCYNNPLRYTDPSGELTWFDIGAGAMIVGGSIMMITGFGSQIGAGLISSGFSHFAYTINGVEDQGLTWDEASSYAGLSASVNFTFRGHKEAETPVFDDYIPTNTATNTEVNSENSSYEQSSYYGMSYGGNDYFNLGNSAKSQLEQQIKIAVLDERARNLYNKNLTGRWAEEKSYISVDFNNIVDYKHGSLAQREFYYSDLSFTIDRKQITFDVLFKPANVYKSNMVRSVGFPNQPINPIRMDASNIGGYGFYLNNSNGWPVCTVLFNQESGYRQIYLYMLGGGL